MIIVTGAAGFIASCLVSKLNQEGYKDIVLVDDFSNEEKNKNLSSVNRFSPRNGPGLVVVSTSGRIVYRGQPEQVIELLQKLIPVDKK